MGLSAGLALANRLKGVSGRVFCLTSDGEWNEGSCWESLIFARHRGLSNLTVIVDANGLQGFGTTKEVADLDPLGEKFATFGAEVLHVDGHDPEALASALNAPATGRDPRVIVAKTCKGCGVSFMEHLMEWHYLPVNEQQYRDAVAQVTAGVGRRRQDGGAAHA
jgi:transketolase